MVDSYKQKMAKLSLDDKFTFCLRLILQPTIIFLFLFMLNLLWYLVMGFDKTNSERADTSISRAAE